MMKEFLGQGAQGRGLDGGFGVAYRVVVDDWFNQPFDDPRLHRRRQRIPRGIEGCQGAGHITVVGGMRWRRGDLTAEDALALFQLRDLRL